MTTMLMQQTSFLQSLIEQLWNSKSHYPMTTTSNNNTSLSNLPVELIDLIITHVDTDTLFKLCRVNRLLRALAQPRLVNHAQQITMRLWIHQHPTAGPQKPLDFICSGCDIENNRMVFEPSRDTTSSLTLQTALPPPKIDGCTVLIKVNHTRRIYSISYKDRIVPVPLDQTITGHTPTFDTSSTNIEDAYGCGWQLAYTIQEDARTPAIRYLQPQSFTCDTDLLDPQVLISSSREKVVVSLPEQQQQNNAANKDTKKEQEEAHDEKKKMMMMLMMQQAQEQDISSTWLTRIVNDTMTSFYQWLSSA
ncbi:hypothetical protein BDA99DRAFT_535572 [Phascolomyces articulosus]|uniref:F-box domain-containing protein n=1 Tax=Phascolomyces articulosus TaxID=60185 RepID=A0AAD5PFT2_9FUNG|nr:hypothetical protein BDA99DRAFT_535572 [Phascolomyces articulosus]